MPGTTPPGTGIQAFWATIQALTTRIGNLEVWQRSASLLQSAGPGRQVLQNDVITGLTWPGGTQSVTYAFAHGLATPAGAFYWAQHVDAGSGNSSAWAKVQSPTTSGCQVISLDPFGAPPAGTAYDLYILAILSY
ncbi:MAG TPA: hypothetical protein VG275_07035 [Solirubrobacteraceae bacterium]|jgi:hypothetical protein|nr:hypothetical protein [Solirubrobacteraceae bacterium]